ncbi:heme biosynthesis HemY N-terminal domain-containing protein [Glaciecola sp. 1036]|uniref:heme biosynthesis HemY N-terminal domain-containing protein n=1 Tax=Alteromonadaceae TaxID=72275 RepID=UPI003D032523
MIKIIVLILILFLALALGHNLIGYEGRVVIATESTVIEMTLISSIIIGGLLIVGVWVAKWLFVRIVRMISGSKNWFGAYSKKQQERAFFTALNAYLIGDTDTARKSIGKTFGGDFQGANYLLAADINNSNQEIDTLLTHASTEKASAFAAAVKQAQKHLHNAPKKSLEALEELDKKQQTHSIVLNLKLRALGALHRWRDVKDLISENKKYLGNDYIEWAHKATQGEFAEIASKEGANALKEKWHSLSRAARKDIANQICYVQLLIDQGLSSEAEISLVEFAEKQHHAAFWGLFKQLNHSEPTVAKRFIEKCIKQSPDNAQYYSVLAHLAFNAKDYELALKAVNKSLELEYNRENALLLAAILEQQQSFDKANALYKNLLQS